MKLLRKITDKRILYVFTVCALFFVPILKQGSFYLVKYGVIRNYDSIDPSYVFYFCIPFFVYLYIKELIKTKRDFDIYDYLFYMLVLAGIIASILAIDSKMSWLGKAYRHEGFLAVLCYYLLFITWKVYAKKEDLKKIINIIVVLTVFNCIYGLLQIYTSFDFILRFTPAPGMATGLCGNPNFFGSLVVTALGIVATKFIVEKFSIKNFLLIILLLISLVNATSLGPQLTYVITLIFFIIFLFIKKKIIIKNLLILIALSAVIYFGIQSFNKEVYNVDSDEIGKITNALNSDILTKEEKNHAIDSGRREIWGKSLKIVSKNLINGVGFDNLYLAYYEGINLTEVIFESVDGQIKAVRKYQSIVDNAHNVYLQTQVSTGLLGLIPYLILCLYTFIRGLKSKENLVIFLLGGFVAYSIQAFANLSVIQVAPVYYVIIGLILAIKE